MQATMYAVRVSTARRFLRRDFLHYGSQLVPERRESETWSLAWAYIRRVDDIIDSPGLTSDEQLRLLEGEWRLVQKLIEARGAYRVESPYLRHAWLEQFMRNLFSFYDSDERRRVLDAVEKLYRSAVMDAERRWRVLDSACMTRLLYYKAVCFFELYFLLGRLDLGPYREKIAEMLGLGLGMLDDFLDFLYDLKCGYINLTREELENLANGGVVSRRSVQILRLLLRARMMATRIRDPLARNLILRLSEAFAAPILEGRFVPGARYFFKGGRFLIRLLPKDEMIAYEVGHRMIKRLLTIPQLTPALLKLWARMVE